MDLAVPRADRRLEVIDIVVEIDLLLDPIRHIGQQVLDAHVAFKRRAHLEDVEVGGAGRDRLLQPGVVIGLSEIDPFDLRAGIGLPRRQEATEQEVVKVLVVEAHEREIDAFELAGLHICFVGPRQSSPTFCQSASVGEPLPAPGIFMIWETMLSWAKDGLVDRVSGAGRQRRSGACSPFHELTPAGLHRHEQFVDMYTHDNSSLLRRRCDSGPDPDAAARSTRALG